MGDRHIFCSSEVILKWASGGGLVTRKLHIDSSVGREKEQETELISHQAG
jgi:hypothetical protein